MSEITGETKLIDIVTTPEFLPFGEHAMICRPSTWERYLQLPISHASVTEHQIGRVVAGFERIRELRDAGQQFAYDIWDDEACVIDPTRRQTKLFFFPGRAGAPFILLLSGGGYQSVCNNFEGFPTAPELAGAGFNVFVLSYRVRQVSLMPKPVDDVAQAVKFIQAHARELEVDERYAVMGFSAGAHLTAEWGTDNLGYAAHGCNRPSALVLCYAPIDLHLFEVFEDTSMLDSVCGQGKRDNIGDFCINEHVWEGYPHTYLWQCKDDPIIDLKHFESMKHALEENGVPYRAKLFDRGGHALTLPDDAEEDAWIDGVIEYLYDEMPLN